MDKFTIKCLQDGTYISSTKAEISPSNWTRDITKAMAFSEPEATKLIGKLNELNVLVTLVATNKGTPEKEDE